MTIARMTNASRIMADLDDPDKYVRVPGVAVFDEHTERYHVGPDGKPCRPDAKGAREIVRVFDRRRLQEIARRCNARDAKGSLSPLTLGHTIDGAPESEQPEPVGYATRYRVAYSRALGRHVILADFHVEKDRYGEAKTYRRVSIELWPRHGVIDPIALLRRTPQRDLGQWVYNRDGGAVLRYSMESKMADSADRYGMGEGEDLFAPPDETPEDGGMSDEEHEQYMRHCHGHPLAEKYAMHCRKKYGMAPEEPLGGAEPPAPPEPDPTDTPDADEPPLKNGAFASTSATNGVTAVKGGKGKYGRDQEAIRFARMEREVAALRRERDEATAARIVTQLVAEDFDIDAEDEVRKFAALPDAERKEREAWIRKYARRAPTGQGRPVARETARGGEIDLIDDPESIPPADLALISKYQRDNRLYDMQIHELAPLAMPAKYGRRKEV